MSRIQEKNSHTCATSSSSTLSTTTTSPRNKTRDLPLTRTRKVHDTETESDDDGIEVRSHTSILEKNQQIKDEDSHHVRKENDHTVVREENQLDRLSKSQLIAKVRALECLVTGLEKKKQEQEYHFHQQQQQLPISYSKGSNPRPIVTSRVSTPDIESEHALPSTATYPSLVKYDGYGQSRTILGVINPSNCVNNAEGIAKKRRGPYRRKGTVPQLSPEQIKNVLEMRKSGRPRECDKPQNSTETRQERVKRLSRERVWRFRERQRIKTFLAQHQPEDGVKLGNLPIATVQALEAQGRLKRNN